LLCMSIVFDSRNLSQKPLISVIMPAFKFRPYITDALISLENQTLNKTYFEVIVVKNFTGEDNIFLKYSLNLLVIHSSDIRLPGKILEAFSFARGDIICFLEDDDQFYREKLRRVSQVFEKYGNVPLYYYNDRFLIDGEGKMLNSRKFSRFQGGPFSGFHLIPNREAKLMRDLPFFNNSSISISKAILEQHVEELDLLHTGPAPLDWFCLVSALNSQSQIIIDNAKLTGYRIHGNQTINIKEKLMGEESIKNVAFEEQYVKDLALLRDICRGTEHSLSVNCYISRFRLMHHLYFYRGRLPMIKKLLIFLKGQDRLFKVDSFQIMIMSLFYLVSPNLLKTFVVKFRPW
jgi:glycosyltransferase involved in cell wall biosynthesis